MINCERNPSLFSIIVLKLFCKMIIIIPTFISVSLREVPNHKENRLGLFYLVTEYSIHHTRCVIVFDHSCYYVCNTELDQYAGEQWNLPHTVYCRSSS